MALNTALRGQGRDTDSAGVTSPAGAFGGCWTLVAEPLLEMPSSAGGAQPPAAPCKGSGTPSQPNPSHVPPSHEGAQGPLPATEPGLPRERPELLSPPQLAPVGLNSSWAAARLLESSGSHPAASIPNPSTRSTHGEGTHWLSACWSGETPDMDKETHEYGAGSPPHSPAVCQASVLVLAVESMLCRSGCIRGLQLSHLPSPPAHTSPRH